MIKGSVVLPVSGNLPALFREAIQAGSDPTSRKRYEGQTGAALVVIITSPKGALPYGKDWPRRPTLHKKQYK